MDVTQIWSLFGIFMIGCGLYGFYAYFSMKKGGPINKILILGDGFPEEKCKDKEELRAKSLPALLLFAITTTVYGVCDFVHCTVMNLGFIHSIVMMLFFIVLLWFMVYTTKLKKELF